MLYTKLNTISIEICPLQVVYFFLVFDGDLVAFEALLFGDGDRFSFSFSFFFSASCVGVGGGRDSSSGFSINC